MAMRMSINMMNDTLKGCFVDCISDFNTQDLNGQEKSCLKNCAQRSFAGLGMMGQMQAEL